MCKMQAEPVEGTDTIVITSQHRDRYEPGTRSSWPGSIVDRGAPAAQSGELQGMQLSASPTEDTKADQV